MRQSGKAYPHLLRQEVSPRRLWWTRVKTCVARSEGITKHEQSEPRLSNPTRLKVSKRLPMHASFAKSHTYVSPFYGPAPLVPNECALRHPSSSHHKSIWRTLQLHSVGSCCCTGVSQCRTACTLTPLSRSRIATLHLFFSEVSHLLHVNLNIVCHSVHSDALA